MTTRNLDALLSPRSVVIVGANSRPGSVGSLVTSNLLNGGFGGSIYLVNPHETSIDGHPVAARIGDLPQTPDLAIIATPAETVPALIAELGTRGCRACVVISAGFEGPGRPAELRQAILDAARPHLMRILGPNCLGLLVPGLGLNASFAAAAPPVGHIALVAQSGAVAAAAMDCASVMGLGFSHVVTVGDCAEIDVADLLDQLALEPQVKAILLYLEGLADGRKFMSAARVATGAKPVVVLKGGRGASGAKAALSHTGALAGASAVYEAAFRRAGLIEVTTLAELLQAGVVFSAYRACGSRIAILTNGGGAGVLAADALSALGQAPVELAPETLAALQGIAPAAWSHGNPVDILGDAPAGLYAQALECLLAAKEVDGILVLNCPTAVTDSGLAASKIIEAAGARPRKPIVAGWLGGKAVASGRAAFAAAGLPCFDTPEDAVHAVALLAARGRARKVLQHAPAAPELGDTAVAQAIVREAVDQGRGVLTDPESRAVLKAYGLPVIASEVASTPQEAGRCAARINGPVALKILSHDITHKSDLGGVRLSLEGATATEAAAGEMLTAVQAARPDARIIGFTVERMMRRGDAPEMLAGLIRDPTFGPVVVVAEGGSAVEARADRALGLPPLDRELAREMIGRTRVSRLLAGYRKVRAADLDVLADCLVSLGQLAIELPEVTELDINPLLCDPPGILALDARIALSAKGAVGARPAIVPYPGQLSQDIVLEGEQIRIRPIRPSDAERLEQMIDHSVPEDVHLRFVGGMRHLPQDLVVRLTQLDYDRQMAFVAEDQSGAFLGVGRLCGDPDGRRAEFALMVRSDRQRHGLGRRLLEIVLDYARSRGFEEVWGDVAYDNSRMLGLAARLGFKHQSDEQLGRVEVRKRLSHALALV